MVNSSPRLALSASLSLLVTSLAGSSLAAPSVFIMDDFEAAGMPDWSATTIQSNTAFIAPTGSPATFVLDAPGYDGNIFLGTTVPIAPNPLPLPLSCEMSGCANPECDWGSRWYAFLYEGESYDPQVSGDVESITVTFYGKIYPPTNAVHNNGGDRIHVAIRQGGLIYHSTDDLVLTYDKTTGPTGVWPMEPLTIEITDLERFDRWDFDTMMLTGEHPTFSEPAAPFEIGLVHHNSTRMPRHPNCALDDNHTEIRDLHFGFDEFVAEIRAIDSDDDGIPDNLDASCDNGADDDGDGGIDWNGGPNGEPPDPECGGSAFRTETPECQDGKDNDRDGGIDWNGGTMGEPPDPQCTYPTTSVEASACGLLGLEVLPLLAFAARRRRNRRVLRGGSCSTRERRLARLWHRSAS